MSNAGSFVMVEAAGRRMALRLADVDRVVHAVEVSRSESPAGAMGTITVAGRRVPIFSARVLLGDVERGVELEDQIVLARAGGKPVALLVEGAGGLCDFDAAGGTSSEFQRCGAEVCGDGLVMVRDLETFLHAGGLRARDELEAAT